MYEIQETQQNNPFSLKHKLPVNKNIFECQTEKTK